MFSAGRLRILVVDDDAVDREIYKQCLIATSGKLEFFEAGSAAEGIRLMEELRPDCVLLDYDLPDRNGLDALAELHQKGLACPVVMLTAFGGEELAVRAMKAGVTDYLPKRRVSSETLSYTVSNAIQKLDMQRRIDQQRADLEHSERRYETLLEAMPQMVWTADPEGRIEYANRRWLDYTGLTIENAAWGIWDELLHPEDRERTWAAWRSAKENGTTFEIDNRMKRASDQTFRWHLVRAVPLKNHDGGVTGWLGTCTEIENQKQAERARQKKEKLEGLGLLAGGIAHDFNNLLVSILGGASFVLDTLPANHTARDILNNVVRAGERAAELTRKMLAYSGRTNRVIEALQLDQLIQETCRFLRPGIPTKIQLHWEGGHELPVVQADAEQLRRIVVELVINGVEAIGDGPGQIWVRSLPAEIDPEFAREGELEAAIENGTQFVAIEVQDTGCGMDSTTQARIFDPFFSTKFTGRGLGLAAVKGLVNASGGAIRVCSTPGAGSVFQVVLPTQLITLSSAAGDGRDRAR